MNFLYSILRYYWGLTYKNVIIFDFLPFFIHLLRHILHYNRFFYVPQITHSSHCFKNAIKILTANKATDLKARFP